MATRVVASAKMPTAITAVDPFRICLPPETSRALEPTLRAGPGDQPSAKSTAKACGLALSTSRRGLTNLRPADTMSVRFVGGVRWQADEKGVRSHHSEPFALSF